MPTIEVRGRTEQLRNSHDACSADARNQDVGRLTLDIGIR